MRLCLGDSTKEVLSECIMSIKYPEAGILGGVNSTFSLLNDEDVVNLTVNDKEYTFDKDKPKVVIDINDLDDIKAGLKSE